MYVVILRYWCRCYHAFKAVRTMEENGWRLFTYWKDKNSNSSRQLSCALCPSSLEKVSSAITGLDEYQKNRANRCVCVCMHATHVMLSWLYSFFLSLPILSSNNNDQVDHLNSTIDMSLLNSNKVYYWIVRCCMHICCLSNDMNNTDLKKTLNLMNRIKYELNYL